MEHPTLPWIVPENNHFLPLGSSEGNRLATRRRLLKNTSTKRFRSYVVLTGRFVMW